MAGKANTKPLLHIVIPVYNEGNNFPALYESAKSNIKTPHKLIVVYDFDEDDTVPVVKKYQKKDKRLTLLKNERGRGVLNALLSGFDYVEHGPLLVIMGDLCDDLRIVDAMYEEYLKGAKVVCPSRYMKGGSQEGGPWLKRTISRLAGVSLYYLRRVPTHDVTNNFRLYDKDFINSLTIESKGGFEVAVEITVKAFRQRQKIVEIPTTWRDRTAGQSKFKLWHWLPSYLRWYIHAFGPRREARR